jgi:hypothetical protein
VPLAPCVVERQPVCTENSDSDVLVMQPADERMRYDVSGLLSRTRNWCILVQGALGVRFIIVPGITGHKNEAFGASAAQTPEGGPRLATDRANQPLGREIDRLNPTKVPRPCRCLWRTACAICCIRTRSIIMIIKPTCPWTRMRDFRAQ